MIVIVQRDIFVRFKLVESKKNSIKCYNIETGDIEWGLYDPWVDFKISKYTVNDDGSLNVFGNVDLNGVKMHYLPFDFHYVGGYLDISYSKLESLRGIPEYMSGSFYSNSTNLKSLEGSPKYVGGEYDCGHNKLESLEGSPKYVGDRFSCNGCPTLEDLKYSPITIGDMQYSMRADNSELIDIRGSYNWYHNWYFYSPSNAF